MQAQDNTYPSWIFYYLCFVTAVSAAFAIIAYADASVLWGSWEAIDAPGSLDLDGPAGLFSARNLGTAALGAYALANRSRSMMEALLVFRITVDLLDGVHAVISGNPPVIAIGLVAAAIEILMLIKLRQHETQSRREPVPAT